MKDLQVVLAAMLLVLTTQVTTAQKEEAGARPPRRYYTQSMHHSISISDQDFGSIERNLQRNLFETRRQTKAEKITIPIIFHILYAPGQSYPNEEQVRWQMEVLNRDFAAAEYEIKHVADTLEAFASKVDDTEIAFCIAQPKGSGNRINGISFIETKVKEWGANWDMGSSERGGSDPFMPEKYVNVWVVNLADSISGWATYPELSQWKAAKPAEGSFEGIVVDFAFFGQDSSSGGTAVAPYDGGKTLTHLVGNYLGLYDLWNEFSICADDYVDDTPVHNAPNVGCQLYKHVSTCYDQPAEMIMNFMDNSDDICQRMFTRGQKLRMQSMLSDSGPRAGLVDDPNATECGSGFSYSAVESRSAGDYDVADQQRKDALTLFLHPNPATNEVNLQIRTTKDNLGAVKIAIYSVQGSLQHRISDSTSENTYQTHLNTSEWAPGMYHALISTAAGHSQTRFIILKDQ